MIAFRAMIIASRILFAAAAIAGTAAVAQVQKPVANSGENEKNLEALRRSRESMAKWIQTQQIISKELADWKTGREILEDRIHLTKGQLEQVKENLAKAEEEIAKADDTKKGNVAKREELLAATAAMRESLAKFEGRIRELHAYLPIPFQEKIAALYQRIPPDPETTKISLAERYQNVIGILNEVNKLNNEIVVASEIRLLGDGKPTEVQTIYLGLGQAYFLSLKGDAAGWGKPTAKGWEWTNNNALVKPLRETLAVMQNKTKPKFIGLQARVP